MIHLLTPTAQNRYASTLSSFFFQGKGDEEIASQNGKMNGSRLLLNISRSKHGDSQR